MIEHLFDISQLVAWFGVVRWWSLRVAGSAGGAKRPARPAVRNNDDMAQETRHLGVTIDRPAGEVYDYAADPANLPSWAGGLAETKVERIGGRWIADSPMGRVVVAFAAPNAFGVLDHDVTLPSGQTVYNPLRVIPDGTDRCDVVFTLRWRPGMSDADFAADAAAVLADLARLRTLLQPR
jgi:hypothetical protein